MPMARQLATFSRKLTKPVFGFDSYRAHQENEHVLRFSNRIADNHLGIHTLSIAWLRQLRKTHNLKQEQFQSCRGLSDD